MFPVVVVGDVMSGDKFEGCGESWSDECGRDDSWIAPKEEPKMFGPREIIFVFLFKYRWVLIALGFLGFAFAMMAK
jgi:hypothetical protein